MLRRSAIRQASFSRHQIFLLRAQLSDLNPRQTNQEQSVVIESSQIPTELHEVNQGRPLHRGGVMDVNRGRGFQVARQEWMHRNMQEDLGDRLMRDNV